MTLNLVLWAAGIVLLVIGGYRANAVWSRVSALDALAENARRYDAWRGSRPADSGETTGADVMRALLRGRLRLWLAVAGVGGLLLIAGFAVR